MSPARRSTDIDQAADRIRQGKLVSFPTETVYGLGASAFDAQAVAQVFAYKGRPADNPLIVHLPDVGWLDRVAIDIPPEAVRLFSHFSPGPLTLVLKKNPAVPALISAGLPTVAVRIPDHEMARALIRSSGLPLVAPSANVSGRPSPTTADHVLHDFAERDLLVLDGGPCAVGVESTVLDMTVNPPVILRPGVITAEHIRDACGIMVGRDSRESDKPKSPGQKYRHYAPRATVIPVDDGRFLAAFKNLKVKDPERIGVFADEQSILPLRETGVSAYAYAPEADPVAAAKALYAALRQFDEEGAQFILAARFSAASEALAYNDRLNRAAEQVKRVLFVCTGNTCRSPMAEVLFNELAPPGWQASSAGLAAREGDPAAKNAIAVMQARGLDLTAHSATPVTAELVQDQTLIVPVSRRHGALLAARFPSASAAMLALSDFIADDRDIGDPFGGGLAVYEKTAAILETAVRRLIEQIRNDADKT